MYLLGMVLWVNNFAQFSQKESKAASEKVVIFFEFSIQMTAYHRLRAHSILYRGNLNLSFDMKYVLRSQVERVNLSVISNPNQPLTIATLVSELDLSIKDWNKAVVVSYLVQTHHACSS